MLSTLNGPVWLPYASGTNGKLFSLALIICFTIECAFSSMQAYKLVDMKLSFSVYCSEFKIHDRQILSTKTAYHILYTLTSAERSGSRYGVVEKFITFKYSAVPSLPGTCFSKYSIVLRSLIFSADKEFCLSLGSISERVNKCLSLETLSIK